MLPGMLDKLGSDHVHMLLCSLRASYQIAIEFDSRPGLKFLVQKVSQLNNAANCYKLGGAAWSLIALTLFDLCISQLTARSVSAEDIKTILESQQKSKNTHTFQDHREVSGGDDDDGDRPLTECDSFFVDFHNLFLDICELYVDILVDKDGHHSKLDEMSRQQLYFLTIEPDDFNDITGTSRTLRRGHITYTMGRIA